MILAFLLAGLTFAALLPVLLPLLRVSRPVRERDVYDRAVYRDQLRELDREIERGQVTEADSGPARLEIQRRLLAAAPVVPPPQPVPPKGAAKSRFLAGGIGAAAAGGALSLYLVLGGPETPAATGPLGETAVDAARWAEQLRAHPDDPANWAAYARAVSRLDRWDDAETAWRRVLALGRASPDDLASLGEVLVMRDGGAVSQEARGLFDLAARGAPREPKARYYLALAALQDGDPNAALARWQALLEDLPPDAPGRQNVARRVEEAARAAGVPVPTAATRNAVIEGMVGKLAARLAAEPGDAEGWTKLGRSYAVLGRSEDAADAYEKAASLRPGDPLLKLAAAQALLAPLHAEDAVPPRAVALLRQVETVLPDDPAVLWYLGLRAARERRGEEARDYWTRLTKVLPEGSDDATMVRAALAVLPKAGGSAP